ncbi:MAG: alpha/beta hydrolase [Planctomycetes bacterium]|nr:alpha/beta hydrolase [Planctomycetota bacterium]
MDRNKVKKLLLGDLTILRLIRSIAFIYIAVAVFVYFCSDGMIFLPQPSSYKDGPNILKIKTKSGKLISALYLPNPKAEFTIIYSHGNAEDLGDIRFILERFNLKGFSVLAFDYQGYGTSTGKPSQKNAYQDIETLYQYLTEQLNTPPNRIIAMGRSIGSAVASHLASKYPIAGLILQSPPTSAFRVITRIPLLPFDKFNNLRHIKKITCPVLVIHSSDDNIIPTWHGRKVFKKANEPKFSLWVNNAGHNDDIARIAGSAYWQKIQKLITAITQKQQF